MTAPTGKVRPFEPPPAARESLQGHYAGFALRFAAFAMDLTSWWLSIAATAREIGIEDGERISRTLVTQRTKTATREDRKWPVTWVGVAGFEPAASSSRTKDNGQASAPVTSLTSEVMSQDTTSHPTGILALDARMTHEPYDVYARLEDPMGVLGVALAQWEARDDTRPQPGVRRAANTAMDAIDTMLRELHAMRSRLVGEIRASDDAAAARADQLLSRSARA